VQSGLARGRAVEHAVKSVDDQCVEMVLVADGH